MLGVPFRFLLSAAGAAVCFACCAGCAGGSESSADVYIALEAVAFEDYIIEEIDEQLGEWSITYTIGGLNRLAGLDAAEFSAIWIIHSLPAGEMPAPVGDFLATPAHRSKAILLPVPWRSTKAAESLDSVTAASLRTELDAMITINLRHVYEKVRAADNDFHDNIRGDSGDWESPEGYQSKWAGKNCDRNDLTGGHNFLLAIQDDWYYYTVTSNLKRAIRSAAYGSTYWNSSLGKQVWDNYVASGYPTVAGTANANLVDATRDMLIRADRYVEGAATYTLDTYGEWVSTY